VIASNVGGLPEIIENGVNGYSCPPEALEDMAGLVADLLRDDDRRLEMGRTASSIVQEKYCTARIVPMYEEAYERAHR
jgi:glycosyltransferase involved in cell wall biosynthesis